ncbi:lipocalin family protein [Luteibacter sahnii]|jgi:apolipoprotein D and lipocalin family protein|uniref:lipocalin family protein n=1 Tax=Luteibacter sahnii TaxID=3021977 RepID=UPI002A6AA29F|nr:lipocalin family protein [Luteibacter sp. PPL193]MDY1547546.1 lipocalin family protein [Luteibacter sp. PPL193]
MKSLTARLGQVALALFPLAACSTQPTVPRVPQVDVARYMGDWYVIASIPSRFEKGAVNAIESYRLQPDGVVRTDFRYRKESATGELKTMHAKGYPHADTNNAVWGMQFIWPIKAQYVISWLDPGYRFVIVARDKRDYVWVMARTPTITDAEYASLVGRVAAMGYNVNDLKKVPQQWPESRP